MRTLHRIQIYQLDKRRNTRKRRRCLDEIVRRPAPEETTRLLQTLNIGTGARLALVTAHRRESFGKPLENIFAALRQLGPARVVVAVPLASVSSCEDFRELVDEVVCVRTPEPFYAVGSWYDDFTQTSDAEVHALLEQAAHGYPAAPVS